MQHHRETDAADGETADSRGQQSNNERETAPLVIVSERGRHSSESRRIVRAQAARASAAQSRVTRARNREEREGTGREGPLSSGSPSHLPEAQSHWLATQPTAGTANGPLIVWISGALNVPAATLLQSAPSTSTPAASGSGSAGQSSAGSSMSLGSFLDSTQRTSDFRPQLPLAVPRGLIAVQQRVQISEHLAVLVSRTSCFDFDSPGVQARLYQLLSDLVAGPPGFTPSPAQFSGHPVQGHLRIACTCLTIFQGQRVNGVAPADVSEYQRGLEAGWAETALLDQNVLTDPNSAPASLWAIFIINVTTGTSAEFFRPILHNLFDVLQVNSWPQVRTILLEFIYPVSCLEEPCRRFYNSLFLN